MTETPESSQTEAITPAEARPPAPAASDEYGRRPNRLFQAAAWLVIVASAIFIVAVIFFSGFTLGKHVGNWRFYDGSKHHSEVNRMPMGVPHHPGPHHPGPPMMGPGPGPGMMPPPPPPLPAERQGTTAPRPTSPAPPARP